MLLGFDSRRGGRRLRRRHHRRRHHPGRDRIHGPARHPVCETFAHAGYPLDVEALLIVEVEGSEDEIDAPARDHRRDRRAPSPAGDAIGQSRGRERGDLEGPQGRLRRHRPDRRLLLHGRRHPAVQAAGGADRDRARSAPRYRFDVANIFHAGDGNLHPLILYNANDPGRARAGRAVRAPRSSSSASSVGGCLTGEHGVGIEKRDLMRLQFSAADLAQQMRVQGRVRSRWLLNPAKVFPLEGSRAPVTGNLTALASSAPNTLREISDLVAEAANAKIPLEVRGRGSKYEVGRDGPVRLGGRAPSDLVGISLYEPTELVMSAAPAPRSTTSRQRSPSTASSSPSSRSTLGPRSARIRPVLDRRRLRHQLLRQPPHPGRRRARSPAWRHMREWLGRGLQIRRPRDEERHRLRSLQAVAGSWGTLAVVTEVTMKVLPQAAETRTLSALAYPTRPRST